MADREHTITLSLCEGDFEMSMGRAPRDDDEFEEWARLCEKGLVNGHIDWDILFECARCDGLEVMHVVKHAGLCRSGLVISAARRANSPNCPGSRESKRNILNFGLEQAWIRNYAAHVLPVDGPRAPGTPG